MFKNITGQLVRYIFLIRAHHWVKNFFIFIPAFFAGEMLLAESLYLLFEGFFCFCFISSAVYILNDYRDMETDRSHPVKKNRPLASGKANPAFALTIMATFLTIGMVWAFMLKPVFLGILLLYFIINIFYSFGLKNVPLVDVFMVSSGFLLRAISGGVLVSIYISQWLIILVFLLSLLLAFAKRRDDLILAKKSGSIGRKSSRYYNLDYINICLSLISGVIMVSYIMYTVSDEVKNRVGENYLYITSLFVFGGILRYLQITMVKNDSGSPTRLLLTDRFLQVTVMGWVLAFFTTLYL